MTDQAHEIAETTRLARRAVELTKDDAVALGAGGLAGPHRPEDLARYEEGLWRAGLPE